MNFLAGLLFGAAAAPSSGMSVQTSIEAPGPMGLLKATMLAPSKAGAPVMLMIPGSGPVDRDGNSPGGLKAASLKLLAEGLAASGIATVPADKRWMYGSAAAIPDANAVTISAYVADVHSWATTIRRQTGVRCVWILGHSEGGLVALAAGRDSSEICGLILVLTAGRPIGDILAEQLKANPANAPLLDQGLSAIKMLETGHYVDPATLNPALLPLFRPAVQDFLIDEMAINPAKLIASFRTPVLILQGQRDIQVSVDDARSLKRAKPEAKLVLLPYTNHVLKTVTSDDRSANIATYFDPNLPLAPDVIQSIAVFMSSGAH